MLINLVIKRRGRGENCESNIQINCLASYQDTKRVKPITKLTNILIKEKAEKALWQYSLTNSSVGHMLKYQLLSHVHAL